ncbi:type 1 periplasmic binding fold superfamily protein [Flavobacteriaceae bacterium TP-CH-4]|uniref:Type 1 periplasmic binding fold superfamily protein n=1 Tax=Pelagihabitans pacificus TaxID=2696054 RepID=A0A967AVM9_9FLAO|nr:type 1 periplasmic binding fold superfamily protein [Pelagihabitans pacificus]NHF60215.1 type 1 periplasmic binding fold superfamily protein [Pelagihabitans pacificus]
MKLVQLSILSMAIGLLTFSCDNDDDTPQVVNEEEVITTLNVTLTPQTGTPVTLQSQDLDGDGPNAPVVTVSGPLTSDTTYNGVITVLNETVSPAENITEEVEEEAEEHQFFFSVGGGLEATTEYTNFDGDQNPLGTEFRIIAGSPSQGTLTFTLRHEPKKPNDGTLSDAGGETDIAVSFDVTVE